MRLSKEADKILEGIEIPECLSWEDAINMAIPLYDRSSIEEFYQDGIGKLPKVKELFLNEKLESVTEDNLKFITNDPEAFITIGACVGYWETYLIYKQFFYPMTYTAKLFQDRFADAIESEEELLEKTVSFLKRNRRFWYRRFKNEPLSLYYYPRTAKKLLKIGVTDIYGFFSFTPLLKGYKAVRINCFKATDLKEYLDESFGYISCNLAKRYIEWKDFYPFIMAYAFFVKADIDKEFPESSDFCYWQKYMKGDFKKG